MSVLVDPPDLPKLEPGELVLGRDGGLELDGVLVQAPDADPLSARRIVIKESELRDVALQTPGASTVQLRDVRMHGCDLSNIDAPDASIWRVDIGSTRMVGFRASGSDVRDLRVADSSLVLATFGFAQLRNVTFERVDLSEATFMEARLDGVEFIDCRLAGADFRGARLSACAIRGTSLDGVLGIESLRGLRMPWSDVVSSVAALAAALGIEVEDAAADERSSDPEP